jgi:TPR repeat protein
MTRHARIAGSVAFAAAIVAWAPRSSVASCPAGDLGGCRAQCDEGDADSCSTLGAIYRGGAVGVPRDEARAVELYRKACALGSQSGCADLRRMYTEGRGLSGKGRK